MGDTDKTLPFDFEPEPDPNEGKEDGEQGQPKQAQDLAQQQAQRAQQQQQQAQPQPAPAQPQQPAPAPAPAPAQPGGQSDSSQNMQAFEDFFEQGDAAPLPAAPQPPQAPPQGVPPGPPPPQQPTAQAPGGGGDGGGGRSGDTQIGKRRRRRATKRWAMDMFLPMALGGLLTLSFVYGVLPLIPGAIGDSVREKILDRGWIPIFTTVFLFWHLSHVMFRYLIRIRPEFRIITMGLLPAGTTEITNHDLQVIGHNASLVDNKFDGGTLLTRRLLLAVAHLQIRRDIAELGDLLRRRAEADRARAANAYSIPNFIFWAIPILGFVGTVLGIGFAIGGLKEGFSGALSADELGETLKPVIRDLGVAFDTTLVALLMSIVAYLTQTLVRQQESQLLADVEDYLTYRLQSRIKTETSEDRMESIMREALQEMTSLQASLSTENQKNSRMTMQTMMTTQESMKHAIDNFPQMLEKASETSSEILKNATSSGQTIMNDIRLQLNEIVKQLSGQLTESFGNVSSALDEAVGKQREAAEDLADKIGIAGQHMSDEAKAAFGQLSEDFKAMGSELHLAAKTTVTNMSETIVGVGDEARMKIQAIGDDFLGKISAEAQGLYTNASTEFQGAVAPLKEFLEQAVTSLEKAVEEGQKLVGTEDLLAKNMLELSKAKKLDEALEGLRHTLVSVQPLLEKLRQPTPLRINLGGVELPVSGTRGF